MKETLPLSAWEEIATGQAAAAQAAILQAQGASPIGFIRSADYALAPKAARLDYITRDNTEPWFRYEHDRPALVPALGCHQVKDCSLHRHGILLHGDLLLTDGSHLGSVLIEEARRLSREDRAATSALQIDGPVLVFLAPGLRVFGHWLVDFLPRLQIARRALGDTFKDLCLPVPETVPAWAIEMMMQLGGVAEDQIVRFDPASQHVSFADGYVPTYGHASYHFHPQTAEFWPTSPRDRGRRRLCISRKNFEGRTDGVLKNYADRMVFEALAQDHGFELVYPETLSIADQAALFGRASHVVGEYGSALHNMLFAPEASVVGALRSPNDVQIRISALKRQRTVIAVPDREWTDEAGARCYSTSRQTLDRFFEAVLAAP